VRGWRRAEKRWRTDHGGLRGRVSQHAGIALFAGDGRDVDDAAIVALDLSGAMEGMKRAMEIGRRGKMRTMRGRTALQNRKIAWTLTSNTC
jgi:hypothetical protein